MTKQKLAPRKVVLRILAVVTVLVVLAGVGVFALFGHEIKTVNSIEKVDEYPLYTMNYDGDYGFDEFLQQGASSDKELIDFVVKRLMKGLPITINLPDLSCATFNATTPDGDALFSRNFDLSYSPAMLVRTKPDNGYESISMVNLGFLGYGEDKLPESFASSITALAAPYAPLDGMNEKGLAVGVLLIDTDPTNQQTDKVDITTTTAIRMLLDKCATVDEALDMLQQYDMHSSAKSCYHFQIADASGKSVVVEYINNEFKLVEPGEDRYMAATNFLLTPGDYDFGGGQDRYQIIMDGLNASKGVETEESAMDLLGAASQKLHKNARGEDSQTQWSVVYNLDKKTADIVMGMDYDHVHEVKLGE